MLYLLASSSRFITSDAPKIPGAPRSSPGWDLQNYSRHSPAPAIRWRQIVRRARWRTFEIASAGWKRKLRFAKARQEKFFRRKWRRPKPADQCALAAAAWGVAGAPGHPN